MGNARDFRNYENAGWKVLQRSQEGRCINTGNALWDCQHSCGGLATLTSQQVKVPPKWCHECRPKGVKGAGLGAKWGQSKRAVVAGRLFHICGCSAKGPCMLADKLLRMRDVTRLGRHLQFTYRAEGCALSADYQYPAMHRDDPTW